MAETYARMRQLIGTTADWASHDIVIGQGEIAIERTTAGDRLKIGNGVARFSQLPYLMSGLSLTLSRPSIVFTKKSDGSISGSTGNSGFLYVINNGVNVTANSVISLTPEAGLTATINTSNGSPIVGQPKGYYEVTNITVNNASARIQADYAGMHGEVFLSVSTSSTGVDIVSGLPTEGLYEGWVVYDEITNKLWRYDGTKWTAEVPTTDLLGTITTAQIEDNAVTRTKFAASIQPVSMVTSVPSTYVSHTIFNTTDGKLYRWDGTKYVATVPTTDLIGQITSQQIQDQAINTAKFAAGIEPVTMVTSVPTVKSTNTIYNTTDGKLYHWDGAAYVYKVPTVDLVGQITSQQIQDQAINTAKFAAGIEPVTNVTSVPTVKSTNTVYNTTDGKLYRWNGSAYVASVAATDLIGQIVSTQISNAAITTAKFAAGIEPVTNVNGVPSSYVTTTVFNIVDGKLYNWNGTGYTATASVSNIVGKITSTQIEDGAVTTPKLAANAVEADKIAANAITSGKIAADAVTAGTVAAGAINTREIAANAVKADQIAAGAVTADELAANSVTAGKVAADAIGANEIKANSIGASELQADSVVAGKVAAGAINTRELVAGAVRASKIAVVTEGMFPDPYVKDAAFWTSDPHVTGHPGSISANSWYISSVDPAQVNYTGTDTPWVIWSGVSGFVQQSIYYLTAPALRGIQSQKAYRFSAKAQNPSNCRALVVIHLYDSSYNYLGGFYLEWLPGTSGDRSILFTPPSGATMYHVQAFLDNPGLNFFGAFAVGSFQVTEATDASLIVDGSITALKIAANSITADQIATNAITADEIAANAVTASELAADSVTAGKVAAGAINTRELVAGAVRASKIAVVTEGLFPDPFVKDPAFWSGDPQQTGLPGYVSGNPGSWTIHPSNATVSDWTGTDTSWVIRSDFAGFTQQDYYHVVGPGVRGAQPGKTYKFSAKANNASNLPLYVYLGFFDINTVSIAYHELTWTPGASGERSVIVTAPSGTIAFRIHAQINNLGRNFSGGVYVGSFQLTEATDASLIVDGSITALKIATNSLTADQIAANAIGTSELSADSVVAGKVAAGAINTRELVAGAVRASKMAIVTEGLFPDPFVKDPAFWTSDPQFTGTPGIFTPNSWYIDGSYPTNVDRTGTDTPWVLYHLAGGFVQQADFMVVAPMLRGLESGKSYKFSGKITNQSSHVIAYVIQYFDSASNYVSGYSMVANPGFSGELSAIVTPPANASLFKIYLHVQNPGLNYSGPIWAGAFRFTEATDASLIVDGTIVAQKLATNAVTADKILAGAITTAKIGANQIVSGHIQAGAITADKLTTDVLITRSSQIADAIILNAKIGNLEVDTLKIAYGAVTDIVTHFANGSHDMIGDGAMTWYYVFADGVPVQIVLNCTTPGQQALFNLGAACNSTNYANIQIRRSDGGFVSRTVGLTTTPAAFYAFYDPNPVIGNNTYSLLAQPVYSHLTIWPTAFLGQMIKR